MNEQEILSYLEQDRVLRIDMIEAIKRGGAKVLYAAPDAVLLTKRERFCLVVSDTVEAGMRALKTVPVRHLESGGVHLLLTHTFLLPILILGSINP